MRILLSNDDGIHAPGLRALYESVRDLGDTTIVAPAAEQSAVGHAITLSDPLKTRRIHKDGGFFGFAVSGTPADCVKLAVHTLLDTPPDIVISGINHGPNPGINIIYSGTVSAATEGTILGIPSMAVSIDTFGDAHWATAGKVVRRLVGQLADRSLPKDTLLNVNVPNLPINEIRGFKVVRMGRSRFMEIFHKRSDPRGNEYYWMDGEMTLLDNSGGETDIEALRAGYVSLTPIGLDLTQYSALDYFNNWDLQL